MALTRLKKHKTIPYINISSVEGTKDWARIGRSTVFDLQLNAQTEENDFIEDEMPTTEIMYYKPALDQELQTNKGDEAFDHIYSMFYNLPTGEDVKRDMLIVFAGDNSDGSNNAWNCRCSLTLTDLDTVAEKVKFTVNINSIERGKVTFDSTSGEPTFTKN